MIDFYFCWDLLIVGKVGYEIILSQDTYRDDLQGDHGYDNREDSMHPIFYGFGPGFRQNFLAEPFRNVDIYPLMSYLLRLNLRTTNGSLYNVKQVLNDFSLPYSWKIIGINWKLALFSLKIFLLLLYSFDLFDSNYFISRCFYCMCMFTCESSDLYSTSRWTCSISIVKNEWRLSD